MKPLNVIASERDARLKLIDLGAAADLRTGTNYTPEESILDPMYCPPEQVCICSRVTGRQVQVGNASVARLTALLCCDG